MVFIYGKDTNSRMVKMWKNGVEMALRADDVTVAPAPAR